MIILGIDPGIATTGYGIVEKKGDALKKIAYGCIITNKKEPLEKRLDIIFDDLMDVIKEYKPDEVAVEEIFFAANSKTAITVGHARGVVLLACSKSKKPIYGYTPLQIKQAVCGYGHGDKKQIQEMVKTLLCLKDIPKPDDAADGLAAAICHANTSKVLSR